MRRSRKSWVSGNSYKGSKKGIRPDLGIYFRSTWEANYARYLEQLKKEGRIKEWYYEIDTFEFPVKKGTKFFVPDFKVMYPDKSVEYHEIKGYMTQKSRTALRRMQQYYPDVKVVVIDSQAYKAIEEKYGNLLPNWEKVRKGSKKGNACGTSVGQQD